jgi:MinD-like ATPase involved in chromosome partitioning or flagellar assembly
MTQRLHCYSFHSVKGGVGKSTLSVLTAVALSAAHPDAHVYLIDMDLTGTSLADVLPLVAPKWDGVGLADPIDLRQPPDGFHPHAASRPRIEERANAPSGAAVIGVPFLNDYLLFTPRDWKEDQDVPPRAISWKLAKGPENLRVLPSSALPRDLARALPVIYDEEHAGFLEGRLEYLLAALLCEGGDAFVVFDTPPTIPGLSRSVLSLALRLTREPKEALSEDGFMPQTLREAELNWSAMLVATQDYQDIRAAARWLDLVGPTDRDVLRLVVNRVSGDKRQRQALHLEALGADSADPLAGADPLASANPLALNPTWVEEDRTLREIFRGEKAPPVLADVLKQLERQSL